MCGIVGYLGKDRGLDTVVKGLQALEYRGYDSAGVAFVEDNNGIEIKQSGRVEALQKSIEAATQAKPDLAIGHTRWATHGSPTQSNAHPHHNQDMSIFVVHNGIIENHNQIREKLSKAGYTFTTQTDTEVIPHLIDYNLKSSKSFAEAFEKSLKEFEGAYAIAAIYTGEPETLFAAKLSSPLILGIADDELILASDPTAVMEYTKDVVYFDDFEMIVIKDGRYQIKNFKDSEQIRRRAETLDYDVERVGLSDYPNFMLKEIFEAPQTIRMATLGRIRPENNIVKLGGLDIVSQQLKSIDRVIIVACGTSFYAGLLGEYFIEGISGIPVEVQLASEFKYRQEPFMRNTALLAISQSGETADTIAAIKKIEDYGALKLGVVNAVGSTIARMTDAGVYCHAGPEQAVASTKAFIAQVTILLQIALYLSKSTKQFEPLLKELHALPSKAEETLRQADNIKKIAEHFSSYKDFLYIGRGYSYPCALEGALKLKEISYIHAEGYAAGEMKHGPLAMIDQNFATLAIAPNNPLLEKTYSNIEEIKARSGPIIAIATEGNKEIKQLTKNVIYIPKTLEQTQPLLVAIVLQLFSYYAAMKLGHNVDRPRNLAKSVTVE